MKKKTLILATGNDILTDDGIALRIADDLKIIFPDADIQTACCGGLDILDFIRDYKKVIFIDSIKTSGGSPGDVYHFKPSDFRETTHLSNLHDVSFLTALELAKSLDIELPEEMHVIAIEIIEDMEFSEEFTSLIKKNYAGIVTSVAEKVKMISG
ncbi:MAG TPA: hydrogenase maturation protease [Bacteroidales bacterium]|nr:hydrogenase maturation protease [Bacteroidales bacterium]